MPLHLVQQRPVVLPCWPLHLRANPGALWPTTCDHWFRAQFLHPTGFFHWVKNCTWADNNHTPSSAPLSLSDKGSSGQKTGTCPCSRPNWNKRSQFGSLLAGGRKTPKRRAKGIITGAEGGTTAQAFFHSYQQLVEDLRVTVRIFSGLNETNKKTSAIVEK